MTTKEEIAAFLATSFPQSKVMVESVGERRATVTLAVDDSHLRPGGTISGPALMTAADVALYVAGETPWCRCSDVPMFGCSGHD